MAAEIEVKCLGDTATIPDLGLHLSRGDVEKITYKQYEGSYDLKAAETQGLVSVKSPKTMSIRQGETIPLAPRVPTLKPNSLALTRAPVLPSPVVGEAIQSAPVVPMAVPRATNKPEILESLLKNILSEVKGLREDLAKGTPTSIDPSLLAQLLNVSPKDNPTLQGTSKITSDRSDTYFIPSNLTDGDGRVNVLTRETSSVGSLDEALAELKARKSKE